MLDSETKRRINDCRDILVGKIPDPKSQVEQITFAMLYKFMSDMDAESEELEGEAKYFNGKYAKYSWEKLISPSTSSAKRLELYETAIREMPKNKNIPPLFREIFKNSYLPYRDKETLKLFLQEINGFTYEHSERLGDAFEYLLSVLGSQGDAGQFRTPRHIIEFMVDVIDPKKNESILDPACGTAGFLISAYKYILKNNSSNNRNGNRRNGDLLTAEERKVLAENISGYDISPDMVRLSLVNMYLHDIKKPHIDSYDTLRDDYKWDYHFDIILANPPFMTPRAASKPNEAFSIKSNRSEVLFVEYIAEHLTPKGRAAVIVPEGIIFQSGSAYKELRETLVKDCLVAVISLPQGTFNPYSGVKTSILIFDKVLFEKTDKILFAKIENDGYHLGTQRHSIEKNDIPIVADGIIKWLSGIRNGKEFDVGGISQLCEVSRNEIKDRDDYNLNGGHNVSQEILSTTFSLVRMGEVANIKRGDTITKKQTTRGDIPVIAGGQKPAYYHNKSNRIGKTITVSGSGAYAGFVNFFNHPIFASDCSTIKPKQENQLDPIFLYNFLKLIQNDIYALQKGAGQPHVYPSDLAELKIPVPPIEIQKEIIDEVELYQKIIDGARMVVKNYKPKIPFDPKWTVKKIINVAEINPKKSQINIDKNLEVSFVPMADMSQNEMLFTPKIAKPLIEVLNSYTYFQDGDVILARVTPCFENGKSGIAKGLKNGIGFGSSEFYIMRPNLELVIPEWIYFNIIESNFLSAGKTRMTGTGGLQRVPKYFLENWLIPCPPIRIQKAIVNKIKREQKIIESNKEAITIFEAKIKAVMERVWSM